MKKILFSLLLTVVFAVPAFSQMRDMPMRGYGGGYWGGYGQMMERGHMDMMGGGMMCLKYTDKLGLTNDQLAEMKSMQREMQKKQIKSSADLKLAEIKFMEIMDVKDFDLGDAKSAVKKMRDIKTDQQLEMLKAMKEMRDILTDEQFKSMQKQCLLMGHKKPGKRIIYKTTPKKPNPKK